jgi:hypothetical protein
MKDFLEYFYFIFSIKEESYNTWIENNGIMTGFIILLLVSALVSSLYYLVIGKKYIQYSTTIRWFLFQSINSLIIFLLNTLIIGKFVFSDIESIFSIPGEVIIFALLNSTIYSGGVFLLLSLILNNLPLSVNTRYIPFNFFKKFKKDNNG